MASRRLFGTVLPAYICKPKLFTILSYSQSRSLKHSIDEQKVSTRHVEDDWDLQLSTLDPLAQVQDAHKKFLNDINPPLKRSFNLASYVNSSETLQELIKVGVSLYDVENLKPKAAKHLVQLDYERDCVKYLKFLVDSGLKPSNLGRFISEFPEIFQVPILELQTRFDYLKTKGFNSYQIALALNRSSYILAQKPKTLDYKIVEFQIEFDMPAHMMRDIVSKYPTVLAHPIDQYKLINFCLSEEFGFKSSEVLSILMQQPKTIDLLRHVLIKRLDLIHNTMKLSHSMITKFPKLIIGPDLDIRHRFSYLKKLKRDQFNPKLPLYVQPSALYNGTDEEFCRNHAKTSLEDYKLFVKTCM